MTLVVLGLSGAVSHDASAALYVDGELVAAAEEERFVRDKHAKNRMPLEAARFCLREAALRPRDVDVVAFPYARIPLSAPARWHYALRHWYAPDRSLDALCNGNRRYRRNVRRVRAMLDELQIRWQDIEFDAVEHHFAHASSAYHLSGFDGRVAVLGIDGRGEYASTFLGYGEGGEIHRIREFYDPDSLGQLYASFTEYLGFDMLDGEYKVMGMAPYGDPHRFDLSRLVDWDGDRFRVNTRYVNTVGLRRYKEGGRGFFFSPRLVSWLGPRRRGDFADEPYVDYAAAMQRLYEEVSLQLIERYLRPHLEQGGGRLVFAGGGALNVKLNQRILELPYVRRLFVQPAAGDAGTALGAAAFAGHRRGVPPQPLRHVHLGPGFSTDECIAACRGHARRPAFERVADVPLRAAELLMAGHPLAWFQGRMEFGPRALGGRSILGCPSIAGIADRINSQIKFRERWRPFCPSIMEEQAAEVIGTDHEAPYMTIAFDVTPEWRERIPEVVHRDGSARVQVVGREVNPRYHRLLEEMRRLTGAGVLLNTSMNRRGEPMVCSPGDALDMFFGSDLRYLFLEDLLVSREATP